MTKPLGLCALMTLVSTVVQNEFEAPRQCSISVSQHELGSLVEGKPNCSAQWMDILNYIYGLKRDLTGCQAQHGEQQQGQLPGQTDDHRCQQMKDDLDRFHGQQLREYEEQREQNVGEIVHLRKALTVANETLEVLLHQLLVANLNHGHYEEAYRYFLRLQDQSFERLLSYVYGTEPGQDERLVNVLGLVRQIADNGARVEIYRKLRTAMSEHRQQLHYPAVVLAFDAVKVAPPKGSNPRDHQYLWTDVIEPLRKNWTGMLIAGHNKQLERLANEQPAYFDSLLPLVATVEQKEFRKANLWAMMGMASAITEYRQKQKVLEVVMRLLELYQDPSSIQLYLTQLAFEVHQCDKLMQGDRARAKENARWLADLKARFLQFVDGQNYGHYMDRFWRFAHLG